MNWLSTFQEARAIVKDNTKNSATLQSSAHGVRLLCKALLRAVLQQLHDSVAVARDSDDATGNERVDPRVGLARPSHDGECRAQVGIRRASAPELFLDRAHELGDAWAAREARVQALLHSNLHEMSAA